MTDADAIVFLEVHQGKSFEADTSPSARAAFARGAHALRVKGMLVEALERAKEDLSTIACTSPDGQAVELAREGRERVRAALAEARKETP